MMRRYSGDASSLHAHSLQIASTSRQNAQLFEEFAFQRLVTELSALDVTAEYILDIGI
jgi:hypothetical protein